MRGRLFGKTALITGAGRGIGRAIAETMASQGARVAVTDTDIEAVRHVAQALPTRGVAFAMDVTSIEQVRNTVEQTVDELGQLDILVNNAGYVTFSTFEDCSEAGA